MPGTFLRAGHRQKVGRERRVRTIWSVPSTRFTFALTPLIYDSI